MPDIKAELSAQQVGNLAAAPVVEEEPVVEPAVQPAARPLYDLDELVPGQPSTQPLFTPAQEPSDPLSGIDEFVAGQPSTRPLFTLAQEPSVQPVAEPASRLFENEQPAGQPLFTLSEQQAPAPAAQPLFTPAEEPAAQPQLNVAEPEPYSARRLGSGRSRGSQSACELNALGSRDAP